MKSREQSKEPGPRRVSGADSAGNEAPTGKAGHRGTPTFRHRRPRGSEQFVQALDHSPLLTARELLAELFPIEADRPSLRWLYLRMESSNGHSPIPFILVDGIRKFDAARVRKVLVRQKMISA